MHIGSGTIERGCQHGLGRRLKQAGMLWDRDGALAVAKVRTGLKRGRWAAALRLRPVLRRRYQRQGPAAARRGVETGAGAEAAVPGQTSAAVATVADMPRRRAAGGAGVPSG